MKFLFPVPPDMIRNVMCAIFYPFLYVFTEVRPEEAK